MTYLITAGPQIVAAQSFIDVSLTFRSRSFDVIDAIDAIDATVSRRDVGAQVDRRNTQTHFVPQKNRRKDVRLGLFIHCVVFFSSLLALDLTTTVETP